MKKLSKDQREEFKKIGDMLEKAQQRLKKAVGIYNRVVSSEWEKVMEAKEELDEAVVGADEFSESVVFEICDYIESKQDKWKGNKVDKYVDWMNQWNTDLQVDDWSDPGDIESPEIPLWNEVNYPPSPRRK